MAHPTRRSATSHRIVLRAHNEPLSFNDLESIKGNSSAIPLIEVSPPCIPGESSRVVPDATARSGFQFWLRPFEEDKGLRSEVPAGLRATVFELDVTKVLEFREMVAGGSLVATEILSDVGA